MRAGARQYVRLVTFEVGADAYGRFMGRYSEPLAEQFVRWAGVTAGQRALDVGCGPGALTSRLVALLGPESVSAVDPAPAFVAAVRNRLPGVDVQSGVAEVLPFPDDFFDHAMAQLVVHFMSDPVGGIVEMARVTRPGGAVSACVWDFGGGRSPLSIFWRAVRDVDPRASDEARLPGAREGELEELCQAAGLPSLESGTLTVAVAHESFDEWWEPYTYGVGPAGDYLAQLDDARTAALRAHCRELLPDEPFVLESVAWAVRARI
jgi:SAM-dependent methyltransferase